MKAVDTNIIVRFLIGDDELQTKIVYNLFLKTESENEQLFVPLLVMLELVWILESVYQITRVEILNSIGNLMLMPMLKFEGQPALQQFLRSAREDTCDLSDLLIAHSAKANSCETVITFDRKASKYILFELAR